MTTDLTRAFATARGVLEHVTPEQYDLPTPCASWTVRDLINHMCDALLGAAHRVETGEAPPLPDTDHTAGDVLVAFDAASGRVAAAFGAPGALEKMIDLSFATLPATAYLAISTGDDFTHAWDLAKATGQSTDLDPELATRLLDQLAPMLADGLRGPDGEAPFGMKVDPPEGASAADRLAAFMGRAV